jgi:hypothetical protein
MPATLRTLRIATDRQRNGGWSERTESRSRSCSSLCVDRSSHSRSALGMGEAFMFPRSLKLSVLAIPSLACCSIAGCTMNNPASPADAGPQDSDAGSADSQPGTDGPSPGVDSGNADSPSGTGADAGFASADSGVVQDDAPAGCPGPSAYAGAVDPPVGKLLAGGNALSARGMTRPHRGRLHRRGRHGSDQAPSRAAADGLLSAARLCGLLLGRVSLRRGARRGSLDDNHLLPSAGVDASGSHYRCAERLVSGHGRNDGPGVDR